MTSHTPNVREPVRTIAHAQGCLVKTSATLRQLAATMHDGNYSALVVTKHDGLHAVVTERDIIRALANGSDPDDDWAVDVMSTNLRTLSPDAPILDAAKLMQDEGIRHVLIEDGDQMSVVSVRDLLAPFIASVEK